MLYERSETTRNEVGLFLLELQGNELLLCDLLLYNILMEIQLHLQKWEYR